jgi:hypothetical protein
MDLSRIRSVRQSNLSDAAVIRPANTIDDVERSLVALPASQRCVNSPANCVIRWLVAMSVPFRTNFRFLYSPTHGHFHGLESP